MQDYAPRCPGCKDLYSKRQPPEEPPCETCRVELLPENKEAAEVFNRVHNQVIVVGMEGKILDLNFQAISFIMDLYGVKDKRSCFEKVVRTFHHFKDMGEKNAS